MDLNGFKCTANGARPEMLFPLLVFTLSSLAEAALRSASPSARPRSGPPRLAPKVVRKRKAFQLKLNREQTRPLSRKHAQPRAFCGESRYNIYPKSFAVARTTLFANIHEHSTCSLQSTVVERAEDLVPGASLAATPRAKPSENILLENDSA